MNDAAQLLIVEDEDRHLKALCETLKDQGYAATGFTSAPAALSAMRKHKFDLLLTDLMMPEMDGITLLRSAQEIDPDLVCIMMTGHGTINTAVDAMQSGALDYILKPFKLTALLPVIERSLAVRKLRLDNAELQRKVQGYIAELETTNHELEAFSYSVSHDLGGPLSAMKLFLEILTEDCRSLLPEKDQLLIAKLNAGVTRMVEMTQALLNLSRLGRQSLFKRTTDLAALSRQVLDELSVNREGRKIETRVADLPDCVGDPAMLKQVFRNLLSNAVKYTRGKDPAVIEVGYREESGEKVYFVRDNGAGFEMQKAEKLFGAFQRLHSHEEFEGTGVGLSIVQRIIQRHGGRIWAEAEVAKGATFYFTLGKDQHELTPKKPCQTNNRSAS